MICEKIKTRLRDYCEDSVPENQRKEIRSHLKECRGCRDYAFAFSSFGTDIRRFALVEPPSGLKEKIINKLETPQAAAALPASNTKLYWMVIAAFLIVLTAAGFWYVGRRSVQTAVPPPDAEEVPAAELETGETAEEVPEEPADMSPLTSSRFAISLQPFHWDVEFPSSEKRSEFVEELRKKYGTVTAHFESPSLVVFSLSRGDLLQILKILTELGAGVKGSGVIPSYIPEFPGNVRVSMDLETVQSRITKTLNHHWHLKFQFPNKFTVKEKLREVGGRMLYEAPEIWVMEFSGRDYEKIHDVIRGTYGLTTNVGPEQFLSTRSRQGIPIRVTMYLEEG